jgi:hypothetical protein
MPTAHMPDVDRPAADALRRQQAKSNLRMALVLASVAAVFFIGFVAKLVVFGR